MWQSLEILNVFNTFTLKWIFWETETFFKKLEYRFSLKALRLKVQHFLTKLPRQKKPMSRKIERGVQNGPVIKSGVLPVTILFFWRFCFSLRTTYKELIWCTNYQMSILILFIGAGVLFQGAFEKMLAKGFTNCIL